MRNQALSRNTRALLEFGASLVAQGAALSAGPGAFAVVGLPRSFSTVIHSFAQVS
jgi:hypothetical protein